MAILAFGAVIALTGCEIDLTGNDYTAYSTLTEDERQWIVPDVEGWGDGERCGGAGDCSGPLDGTSIQTTLWAPISSIESTGQTRDGLTSVGALVADRPSRVDPSRRLVTLTLRANESDLLNEALSRGLEVWASADSWHRTLLVFDETGRVASIGFGSAQFAAEPLIRHAENAGGSSPYLYFLSLVTGPSPQRLLTAADPGLAFEKVTGKKLRRNAFCVTYGNDGPTLVFPDGTVSERSRRSSNIDVLNDWSGLDSLPFRFNGKRVELTIQRATTEALGVAAFDHCGTEAFYVAEIRIIEDADSS